MNSDFNYLNLISLICSVLILILYFCFPHNNTFKKAKDSFLIIGACALIFLSIKNSIQHSKDFNNNLSRFITKSENLLIDHLNLFANIALTHTQQSPYTSKYISGPQKEIWWSSTKQLADFLLEQKLLDQETYSGLEKLGFLDNSTKWIVDGGGPALIRIN